MRLFSAGEVAKKAGVSRRAIQQRAARLKIGMRVGSGGTYAFSARDVKRLLGKKAPVESAVEITLPPKLADLIHTCAEVAGRSTAGEILAWLYVALQSKVDTAKTL